MSGGDMCSGQRASVARWTVFDDERPGVRTGDALRRRGIKTVRSWDEERWRTRSKRGK